MSNLNKEQRQVALDKVLYGNLANKQRSQRIERGSNIIMGFINRGIQLNKAK